MNYKWFVGIDISKKTLDVTLFSNELKKKSSYGQFCNANKGYESMVTWLNKLGVSNSSVVICMEHTGVYGMELAWFLEKNKLVYSMVSPLHIKRSLGLVRGKNDKVDSYQISRYCYLHRDEIHQTKLPQEVIRTLKSLYKERERLVKMQTSEKIVLSELRKSNTASTIKRIESRLELFSKDIENIEQEIKQIINCDLNIKRNYQLMRSVIGIGLINSVLFLINTCNFQSFTDARKYACYGGVAPFDNTSGTSIRGKTQVSHLANKCIKVNLSNAARSAIQNDPELRLYYNRKLKEGKEHGIIMNAVKFKLIARVFAVVKRGTPFVKMRQAG